MSRKKFQLLSSNSSSQMKVSIPQEVVKQVSVPKGVFFFFFLPLIEGAWLSLLTYADCCISITILVFRLPQFLLTRTWYTSQSLHCNSLAFHTSTGFPSPRQLCSQACPSPVPPILLSLQLCYSFSSSLVITLVMSCCVIDMFISS